MSKLVTNDNLKAYHAELAEHIKLLQRGTAYSLNDIVNYDGKTLKCTTAGTTATTKPDVSALDVGDTLPDGTAVWTRVDLDKRGIDYWASSTDYALNDQVVHNDKIYKCSTAHTSTSTFDDTKWAEISAGGGGGLDYWASSTTYALDDVVIYNDKIYRCTTAHTSSSTFDDTKFTEISAGGGGGIATYTSGTSYSSGDLVIKDQVLYQANTTTSTTWVDSEWDVIGTNFNTTSTYAQKIVTNVVAPYEMLLQVGDSNYCKPPIDVLKKTGGSDNVTLTLENYNNASAYTGTSDFLKIANSKAKLYNYKEYPITPQTLSTIDIGVSDEIDFDDFYPTETPPSSNVIMSLRATSSGIIDIVNNTWITPSGEISPSITETGIFGNKCIGFNGVEKLRTSSPLRVIGGSDDFTFSCWIKYTNTISSYAGSVIGNTYDSGVISWDEGLYNFGFVSTSSDTIAALIGKSDTTTVNTVLAYGLSSVTLNTWHHLAFVRNSGTVSTFFDGILIESKSASGLPIGDGVNQTWLGTNTRNAALPTIYGFLDDICLLKGIALWTSNFTPPSDYLISIKNYNITSLEVN